MSIMFLRVLMTLAPGGLEEGEGFEFSGDAPWVLGRAPGFGPELKDRSISRKHGEVVQRDDGQWVISNVSGHNGMFVDGQEVEPGESCILPGEVCHLQLGSVVFELKWLQETRPFTHVLGYGSALAVSKVVQPEPEEQTMEADDYEGAWFELNRDGDCCTVHLKGRLLTMKPSCALVLYALCKYPGEVVHGWDILDEMGGEYDLPQAISGLRRHLREAVEMGWLSRAELERAITTASMQVKPQELKALDLGSLMRKFIMSRRGHGYALMVQKENIALSEDG